MSDIGLQLGNVNKKGEYSHLKLHIQSIYSRTFWHDAVEVMQWMASYITFKFAYLNFWLSSLSKGVYSVHACLMQGVIAPCKVLH